MKFNLKHTGDSERLGILLANRRLLMGLSERDLFRLHGFQIRTISNIANGKNVTTKNLFKYCDILKIDVSFDFQNLKDL